jgi:hypothetical protein
MFKKAILALVFLFASPVFAASSLEIFFSKIAGHWVSDETVFIFQQDKNADWILTGEPTKPTQDESGFLMVADYYMIFRVNDNKLMIVNDFGAGEELTPLHVMKVTPDSLEYVGLDLDGRLYGIKYELQNKDTLSETSYTLEERSDPVKTTGITTVYRRGPPL